jgi:hypothetical protein
VEGAVTPHLLTLWDGGAFARTTTSSPAPAPRGPWSRPTRTSPGSRCRAGISAELFAAGPLRQFVIAFADNVDFRSEVFSYRKDIEVERE